MSPPHFLDTDVLLYSISRDPAEALKRERAMHRSICSDEMSHGREIEGVTILNPFR